jgi:hypothetical protein
LAVSSGRREEGDDDFAKENIELVFFFRSLLVVDVILISFAAS